MAPSSCWARSRSCFWPGKNKELIDRLAARKATALAVDQIPRITRAQVIARAMQKYGLILADNGSAWYISGAPDERWDNDVLQELDQVVGSDGIRVS